MSLFNEQETDKVLLKIGEVSSVNPAACTARVVFDDDDSLVSGDLQILQMNSLKNKAYWLPDVGEDVVCIFLGTGVEEGFILGATYAGAVKPPVNSQDKRAVHFADGSFFEYDRSASEFKVEIGASKVTVNKNKITAEATTVEVKAASKVDIEGASQVNVKTPSFTLTTGGGATLTLSGSNAQISSSDLTFVGSMTVTGNLSVSGDITASGTVHGTNI